VVATPAPQQTGVATKMSVQLEQIREVLVDVDKQDRS
jgi:hypothetical protein